MPEMSNQLDSETNGLAAVEYERASVWTPGMGPEPEFPVRARRILCGDRRPEDYLQVTPDVQKLVERDMAFLRVKVNGRFELDDSAEQRQTRQYLLEAYHDGESIGVIEDDTGVIVLAVGRDQFRAILASFPYEMRRGYGLTCPNSNW